MKLGNMLFEAKLKQRDEAAAALAAATSQIETLTADIVQRKVSCFMSAIQVICLELRYVSLVLL